MFFDGAMATFMNSPALPVVVRTYGVSPLKFSSRPPAILCVALPSSSASTPDQILLTTKHGSSKERLLHSGEFLCNLSDGNFEENEEIVEDEGSAEDDGTRMRKEQIRRAELKGKLSQILSNAQRLKSDYSKGPCYSLGIDYGEARTGVAISKGFAPRPVEVIKLKGQRLEAHLIEVADREGAVEFVVGLPKCSRGLENWQTNKTRCFAGRLAVLAATRGWRVYVHDEFGTSNDALDYMIMMGSTKKSRQTQLDAYAAVALLKDYFNSSGEHAELVVPKKLDLQERLCEASVWLESDDDFQDENY